MGAYALEEVLERGPDGVVYRAREQRSGRSADLRLLPASAPPAETAAVAKRMAALIHPHLPAVLDSGTWRDRSYLVFQEAGVATSDLPLREAVALVRDAATGVDFAGGRGLAHPGLQPACLRLGRRGVLVVGYERLRGPLDPAYQAPEVRGGGEPTAPANVYSLGAVLYLLAAGRAPAAGMPEPPSRANPLIPGDVEDLILRAMDVSPSRRPSAGALAAGLSKWLDGPGRPVAVAAAAPRRRWIPLAVGTGLLVLLVVLSMLRGGGSAPAAPAPVVAAPPPPAPEPLSEIAATVESVPPKARVSVDGRACGATPLSLARKDLPGTAPRVRVELDGYVAWERTLDPLGPRQELRAVLEALPVPVVDRIPDPLPPPPPPVVVPAPVPPPPAPAPAPPPPPSAASLVGTVKYVHAEYGIFVRLEPGVRLAAGDALEALGEGSVAALLTVQKVTRPDAVYPHGAAVCSAAGTGAAEGQKVRRKPR